MDAQSRGRADEIDPADQWVLNPRTGNYELRLGNSAEQRPSVATPRRARTSRTAPPVTSPAGPPGGGAAGGGGGPPGGGGGGPAPPPGGRGGGGPPR
ncbi:LytR family transcriptional regulator, partial [Streptomyces sp. NPDC058279]